MRRRSRRRAGLRVQRRRSEPEYPLTFPSKLRAQWKSEDLRRKWFRQYQGIVTARENVLQPSYGFREWFTALHFWETYGFRSAIGYRLKSRPDPQRIVRTRIGDDLWKVLLKSERGGWPDLFVYDPEDPRDWFFVETKGPGERLTRSQAAWFPKLKQELRKAGVRRPAIVIVRVIDQPPLPRVRGSTGDRR
jgi:hypothetical protein